MHRRALIGVGLAAGATRALAQARPNWPQLMVLATASPGGTYHAYGEGLARILQRALGVAISTRETEGPNENLRLIESGEAQLGFVTAGAALHAWSGTGGQPLRATRAIFAMYDTPLHFVVRRDTPIRSLDELSGKRLGAGPTGGTAAEYMPRLLGALGIQPTLEHGSWADLGAQLREGGLDGLAVAAGVPFPAIAELEARNAIRYLPLSGAQIATVRLAVPELTASVIPAGSYPSLRRPYETVGLYNIAVARADLPADLVQEILRAVFDNHEALMEAHPAAAATVPANFVHNTVLPWHDGAQRYYAGRAVRGTIVAD